MEVKSALADIEFYVADARRDGDRLKFSSAPTSSLEATVYLAPRDVAALLWSVLRSGSALGFVLSLPWLLLRRRDGNAGARGEQATHPFDDLNKPW
ncbi:MAG: hypothetical protein AAGL49_04485 [Pseudomonadota bacterium]